MGERFRRGFKTDCEHLALELRTELGLGLGEALEAGNLATHLAIPLHPFEDLVTFGASSQDVRTVRGAVSAFTVIRGSFRAIFFNSRHPLSRQANSVAHELSHTVLEHAPTVAVFDGRRVWDSRQESEADWLAGTLLVPREGALRWFRSGGSMDGGAAHFRVSDSLFQWRVNQTGVAKQMRLAS